MNRIFGFFKQKISEAKQQNKQQLQSLASALIPESQYQTDKVLAQLQAMKSNYMHWNLLIANEASTGLYYSQVHNRNICLRKIKANKELKKTVQKNKMKLEFIKGTKEELMEIGKLSGNWMNQVNAQIQGIQSYLEFKQNILLEQKKIIEANSQKVQNTDTETKQQASKTEQMQKKQQKQEVRTTVKQQKQEPPNNVEQIEDDEQ